MILRIAIGTLLPYIPAVARFRQNFAIFKGGLAAQDDLCHSALYLPALKGRPPAAGEAITGFDLVDGVLVHFHPGFRLFRQVEDALGVGVQAFNNVVHT